MDMNTNFPKTVQIAVMGKQFIFVPIRRMLRRQNLLLPTTFRYRGYGFYLYLLSLILLEYLDQHITGKVYQYT